MNIERIKISLAVTWTLLCVLGSHLFFPQWPLWFFSPLLIILFYQKSLLFCLWSSCCCGVFLDLLSSHLHFGFYATSYTLTTALLYRQNRNFFADSLTTMPLMTFFFSFLSTLIQSLLIYFFHQINAFSIEWIFTDLLILPAFDGIYAFVVFTLPMLCFGKPERKAKDYFI